MLPASNPDNRGFEECPRLADDPGWEPETALGGRSGDDGPWLPTRILRSSLPVRFLSSISLLPHPGPPLRRFMRCSPHGAWRSLVSAPALGAGGRRFESARPDPTLPRRAVAALATPHRVHARYHRRLGEHSASGGFVHSLRFACFVRGVSLVLSSAKKCRRNEGEKPRTRRPRASTHVPTPKAGMLW